MENRSFRAVLVLCGLMALPLSAQDPIRGPMLGWVWDARQESIRPILGIAGSSVLGKAAELGVAVRFASISGNQEHAFALGGEARDAIVVDLRPITPTFSPVAGIPPGATRAALSPRGTAALLWYAESNKLTVIGGLPQSGALIREIDLSVEGAPGALAITDDASLVMAAYPESKALILFDPDGNRWKLPKESAVTALVFLDNSRDALIAAEDGVFLIRDTASSPTFRSISSIASAGALAVVDAGRVLIVDGSVQAVVELAIDSGDSRSVQCPCAPTGLARMSGNGIFRLNELSRGPLWLVEITESGLRTVFVPPDPSDPELEE